MKIALTGGAGIQAMSAMIYLLDQEDVDEIFVSDVHHLERLEQRIARLGDRRLRVSCLDCTDEDAAAQAFAGYDVVINSAMVKGRFVNVTRAALAAGAHYLDMTSLGEEPLQFELNDEFEKRGLTAILDMGTAPGLSNIMAAYCIERLERTESIDFAWGVINVTPADHQTRPMQWGYGFEGIMHLMSGPSIVYEDGEIKRLEPRAMPEPYPFKSGEQVIAGMPHREPEMLAESFADAGIRRIRYRQAFDAESERKYAFLRDLGFASHEPIDVNGAQVAPYDVLWALIERLPPERGQPARFVSEGNCIARGTKDGVRTEVRLMVRTDPDSEMHRHFTSRGAYGSYRTGICAAITAVMLGRGEVTKRGVYRPEQCVPATDYIREQRRVGMEVEEAVRELE
jgi:saccharopine dehydrogenase-like NADP-dependent oxidoreductase